MPRIAELTPKMYVAIELLENAIDAYFRAAYFAAIQLAGGAEEIFGKYIARVSPSDNAFASLKNFAVELAGPSNEKERLVLGKAIGDRMTYARNRTKHINQTGDDDILFDPDLEAKDLLDRAVTDYYHLMNYFSLPESDLLRRFNSLK